MPLISETLLWNPLVDLQGSSKSQSDPIGSAAWEGIGVLGLGLQGLGFRVWGLGFRVWGLGFGV